MTFKRVFIQVLCIIMLAACLVSCSEDAQPTEGKEQKVQTKQSAAKSSKSKMKAKGNSKANGNAKGDKEVVAEKDNAVPALEGGSEKSVRNTKLVSNSLLHKKYPQTLFLRGSLDDNRVALTFDDGPDRRFTPKVLDVLKKHDVKATFFLMGARVAGLPAITKRIDAEGHSIGNHTYWHPKLYVEQLGRMQWEVTETEKAIESVVGYYPKLFRAPYGGLNEEVIEMLADLDLTAIGWSVDSLDWRGLAAAEVQKNVLANTSPGSIILMHSGGNWNQDLSGMVEALDVIIPKLKEEGIEFVTVGELLNISDRK